MAGSDCFERLLAPCLATTFVPASVGIGRASGAIGGLVTTTCDSRIAGPAEAEVVGEDARAVVQSDAAVSLQVQQLARTGGLTGPFLVELEDRRRRLLHAVRAEANGACDGSRAAGKVLLARKKRRTRRASLPGQRVRRISRRTSWQSSEIRSLRETQTPRLKHQTLQTHRLDRGAPRSPSFCDRCARHLVCASRPRWRQRERRTPSP